MKLSLFFVVFLSVFPAISKASDADGLFLDGSVGNVARPAGNYDSTPVTTVSLGYRWSWFDVEGGYVGFNQKPFGPSGAHAYTLGVGGHWNLDSNWFLTANAGALFYESRSWSSSGDRNHSSHTSWKAGVGAGYDFNQHFSLGLNYDWYEIEHITVNGPSLKAEFRF
jgi:opacity protein-like surface antigen